MSGFKDGSCKWEFKLIPKTVLLHFQKGNPRSEGITLRGTELKPRLDKYIKEQLINEKKEDMYSNLLYKVKIVHEKPSEETEKNLDTSKVPSDLKKLILKTSPKVTIICFDKTYQAVLEKYVRNFFETKDEPGFGKRKKGKFGKFQMKE